MYFERSVSKMANSQVIVDRSLPKCRDMRHVCDPCFVGMEPTLAQAYYEDKSSEASLSSLSASQNYTITTDLKIVWSLIG